MANFTGFWSNADFFGVHAYGTGIWVHTTTLIGLAMVGALFSSSAWPNVTFTAAEVRNPGRNLPLSLALGTGLVMSLYLLANFAYLHVLPLTGSATGATVLERGIQYASQDRVGTAAAEIIIGSGGAVLVAIAVMISTFGCNNGLILAGARIYVAGQAGLRVVAVTPESGSPRRRPAPAGGRSRPRPDVDRRHPRPAGQAGDEGRPVHHPG